MQVHRAFCVLRPSSSGVWSIQNDTDHAPHGIHCLGNPVPTLVQTATSLKVYFDPIFVKVGALQITPDDGIGGSITANASFGTQVAEIVLRAWPFICGFHDVIDPADMWSHIDRAAGRTVPRDNGNLWCTFEGWIA